MISLKKITEYSLLACVIVLPFSNALVNIFFALFILLSGIYFFKNKSEYKQDISSILFILLLIYTAINATLQGSLEANIKFWRFFPLLILGFLLTSKTNIIAYNSFKNSSIITCILFIFYTLYNGLKFYINNQYLPLGNGEEINQILILHRPYLGFLIVLNIIFVFDNIIKGYHKKINYFILLCLIAYLILISARLSVLTVLILASLYLVFYSGFALKKKIIFSTSFLCLIITLTLLNPYFKERTKQDSIEQFIDYEPRFVIWKSVGDILQNEDYNSIFGYGNQKLVEEYLVINYEEILIDKSSKKEYYLNEKFNTHSQFLDYIMFGGIIGCLLFTIYFIILLIKNKANFINTAIIISFICFFLVENLFQRQLGVYLFIFYISIFLNIKTTDKNNLQ